MLAIAREQCRVVCSEMDEFNAIQNAGNCFKNQLIKVHHKRIHVILSAKTYVYLKEFSAFLFSDVCADVLRSYA